MGTLHSFCKWVSSLVKGHTVKAATGTGVAGTLCLFSCIYHLPWVHLAWICFSYVEFSLLLDSWFKDKSSSFLLLCIRPLKSKAHLIFPISSPSIFLSPSFRYNWPAPCPTEMLCYSLQFTVFLGMILVACSIYPPEPASLQSPCEWQPPWWDPATNRSWCFVVVVGGRGIPCVTLFLHRRNASSSDKLYIPWIQDDNLIYLSTGWDFASSWVPVLGINE